jgi:regulator of RNase E activity RraA
MTNAGLKALARRLCVGHAHVVPVRWNCEVEVFGRKVLPGQLIHADTHGFLAIPPEDEARLLDAARFMDSNECNTVIPAARGAVGLPVEEVLKQLDKARGDFRAAALKKFSS